MTTNRGDKDATLRVLFWESTARCNLSCAHCRRLETPNASAAGLPADELSADEFRSVLDSVASISRALVIFSGGEPLLRDDWEALAAHAKSLSLPTALATNATLINAELARRVAAAGFRRVSVSLDGADAATHDALRGREGAFDQAIIGIDHLRSAGASVQINSTIARHNIDQLDGIFTLSKSLGAEAMHLFLLVPVGCGLEVSKSHQLAPAEYESVLNWICDRQLVESSRFELRATCAPHYARVAAQRSMPLSGGGCLAGSAVAFVSHTGEVFPCGYLPVRCGSVRESDFARIWRESEVFASLRDRSRLEGKCGCCEYVDTCVGCRARAMAETGNYLAAEPACMHVSQ